MIRIAQGYQLEDPATAAMFEDRKQLFVDLLAWNVPVVRGRFELDQLDGDGATYVMDVDDDGRHAGSMRLLPTATPHLLGSVFSHLCEDGVPVGLNVWEITRLCLPLRLGAPSRLRSRNRLISAMTDHALACGIRTLTAVVAWPFLEQVMAMGWRCVPLGPPVGCGAARLGAFRIDLDAGTPALLAANGIYTPGTIAAREVV